MRVLSALRILRERHYFPDDLLQNKVEKSYFRGFSTVLLHSGPHIATLRHILPVKAANP